LRERLRTSTGAWLIAIAGSALAIALLLAWITTLPATRTSKDAAPAAGDTVSDTRMRSGPLETGPEAAPTARVTRLEQFTPSGDELPLGGNTPGGVRTVVTIAGDGADTTVDVEVKPAAEAFDGAGLRSWPVADDHQTVLAYELPPGTFHWRARARDGERGTDWIVFDPRATAHFIVVAPPAKPAPKPRPGVPSGGMSGDDGDGDGAARPRPSIVDDRATISDLLRPIAVALAGLAVVMLAGLTISWLVRRRWPRRRVP
jgi:hypothetical protein